MTSRGGPIPLSDQSPLGYPSSRVRRSSGRVRHLMVVELG